MKLQWPMMYKQVTIATIAFNISLISAGGSARDTSNYIIINTITGENVFSCFSSNSTTPCKNLSYVLRTIPNMSLSDREVILQGDHYINQTLTIADVERLTIRGSDFKSSTIHCMPPNSSNDTGSGLVFVSISNLTVSNVRFKGCGTLQNSTTLRNGSNIKYRSAVYILNCINVHFIETIFDRSVGRGLSLYDDNGYVLIRNTTFVENMVPKEEQDRLIGGGGLYIEFTYCTPGYPNCNFNENLQNQNSTYEIKDCVFKGNRVTGHTSNERTAQNHIVQFPLLVGNHGHNLAQGAGISISFKGTSSRNSITIFNCVFYNNSAEQESGGGVEAILEDYASKNTLHINACKFTNNSALERSGGALKLGYVITTPNVNHNNITVQDTLFVNNSAAWGGAVSFFASRFKVDLLNRMEFINCSWIGNTASVGAAMHVNDEVWDSIADGIVPTTLLCSCKFINNYITNTPAILKGPNGGIFQQVLQSGTLDIDSFEITLSKNVSIVGSTGSAIVATSAHINVLEDTVLRFVNNSATNGGAMALLGHSVLELHSNSQVIFESNYASERGGAVYALQPAFTLSHRCFISYHSSIDPNKWNSSLTFSNNKARYGDAIFTDSLLQCAKHTGNVVTDVKTALRWEPFKYIPGIEEYTIATSPASINFTLPVEITPGERINLHLISLDDLDQHIPTAYQVFLDIHDAGRANTSTSYISDDGYLQLSGTPGTEFTITLQTQNTRHISFSRDSKLGHCPLGFTLKNEVCVCSPSTSDKRLVGITECNMSNFRAFLQIGHWVGCTRDDKIATSYCPPGYCNYKSASDTQKIDVPKSCNDVNICTSQRKGWLCGECEEGSAVFYHSENFKCDQCPYGAFGLLFYVISELVPLILLFAVIMIMKVKMTSGLMQSTLLFAQTVTFINRIPTFMTMSPSNVFIRIHTFLIGFLSLDLFTLDELSFCLWNGATVLQNFAFRYITTLFTMLLLAGFILLIQYSSLETKLSGRVAFCQKLMKWGRKKDIFKNAIVHGISTFLILSYTQYTVTSFQILTLVPVYTEGEKTLSYVVYHQGSVEYFGAGHLPYAIPAVFVLLLLSLPPPLLLISYPLLWKVKGKLISHMKSAETENETTPLPIRRLLPLIDSFQGVFKDNRRMFAGLLFLWRIILAIIFAFSTNITQFFLTIEVALLCFFVIHAVARPYKRRLFNIIDLLMLANMSIINALTWYIFNASSFGGDRQSIEAANSIKIILMYLPLLALAATILLWFLRKFSIMPKQINFMSYNEEDLSANNIKSVVNRRKKSQITTDDDDLFSRAAEMNSSPLAAASSEIRINLQTNDTTCECAQT